MEEAVRRHHVGNNANDPGALVSKGGGAGAMAVTERDQQPC